jgi:predicted acyl esterase
MQLSLVLALACVFACANAFNCLIAVNITMRDGVELYTCVDFPLGTKQTHYDLVMDRSPYGSDKTELIADIYLLEGYVAVRQDMRGTFDSGGHFTMCVPKASVDCLQRANQTG